MEHLDKAFAEIEELERECDRLTEELIDCKEALHGEEVYGASLLGDLRRAQALLSWNAMTATLGLFVVEAAYMTGIDELNNRLDERK